ncbi:copper-binding protein [Paraburkholderia sp. BCC1886]|uniref:copper-binding protein n=1 Tax=Paraburkholderia sp. BCC1886 TaxID=2562670 RepID=UPI0021B39237|nr:copper-binding protein [Paraburkholderia sp. BCC1886]
MLRFNRLMAVCATIVAALALPGVPVVRTASAQDAGVASGTPAVGAMALLHIQASVVGISPDSNTVTLRGPRGNLAVIEINREVADVTKLRVGDTVDIAYKNAILISADKLATRGIRERVETEVAQPASGGVVASARRVEVIATVQKIDRKHGRITLRGPERTETFDATPDIALDKLKTGDSVRAVFVAAAAASVSRDGVEVK